MLTFVAIIVDGLVYSSWLFVVAIGLSLIFGVMKILNVAHGSLYAFGAYASAWMVGHYFQAGWPPLGSFLMMLLAALVVGVILGLILERGLLRLMYGRDEVVIVLVTFAAFLILEDAILLIWGTDAYFAFEPYALLGNLEVGRLIFSNYDLGLIALALAVGGGLWWGITRTRWGKLLLVVIHDREMAVALGINVTVVFTLTFIVGAILGGIGGAFTAPTISVAPGMGVEVIVLAFAVCVIGGLGSIPGAAIGALIVGICRAASVHLAPNLELFVIYGVMALVLAFRPQGLFSQAAPRKI